MVKLWLVEAAMRVQFPSLSPIIFMEKEVEHATILAKVVKVPRKLVAQKNFDKKSKQSVQP